MFNIVHKISAVWKGKYVKGTNNKKSMGGYEYEILSNSGCA